MMMMMIISLVNRDIALHVVLTAFRKRRQFSSFLSIIVRTCTARRAVDAIRYRYLLC